MGKPIFDPSKPFDAVASADAVSKPAFDPSKSFDPVVQDPQMSLGKASAIGIEKGALLGLRPVVAGLGAAAGDFSGQMQSGKPLSIDQIFSAFKQGRSEANDEQKLASTQYPKASLATDVAGSALTLPFLPAKGLAGAVRLGTGLGAAEAAGSANSLKEAGTDVALGGATGGAVYGAGKAVAKAGQAVVNSDFAQKVAGKAKDLLLKIPSELTGISDKEIESYATRADKVNKIFQDSGGDPSLAAQHMKENILNDVVRTRQGLNSQISQALQASSPEKSIDVSGIVKNLENTKTKINPVYGAKDLSAIDDMISKIKQVAGPEGKLNVQELQDTKNFLYDSAKNTYSQDGNIFPVGKDVARAAKSAGSSAKQLIDQFGPPEIKNANRQLSQLHEIEDHMGNNLLNPNAKSHGDIYAVGGGVQNNNSQALQQLGDITGQDYLSGATDLAAARTFGNPTLLPSIKTGRALIGPAIGGSVGGMTGAFFGHAPGAYMGSKVGAGIGAALSSPAALKLAIDTGRIPGKVLSSMADAFGVTPGNTHELYQVLQSPQAQEIFIKAMSQDNQAAADEPNFSTNIRPSSYFKGNK